MFEYYASLVFNLTRYSCTQFFVHSADLFEPPQNSIRQSLKTQFITGYGISTKSLFIVNSIFFFFFFAEVNKSFKTLNKCETEPSG